ncbi:hypothetical protein ACOKM5_39730 [Streptomyces sp. BH097]|uniref:hypothetical protein n=1 Tax=unclassified Streptomyces TaxID=2593676 RepID=UPI003BB63FE9
MSEERRGDFSDADIDREFAAIVRQGVRDTAADAGPEEDPVDRVRHATAANVGKPAWYLVPLRILCSMTFFMTLWLYIAVHGGVMNHARWGTATLISFCVAVGSGVCRGVARARYDRRAR